METKTFVDTHILVWLYSGEISRFSPKVKKIFDEDELFLSPISLLEMDYLYEIKRTRGGGSFVFNELQGIINLQIAQDSLFEIVNEASHLSWTRDAFDRLIVAQAELHKGFLITADRLIRKHYSRSIW